MRLLPLAGTAWVRREGSCVQHALSMQASLCPTAKDAFQGEAVGEGDLALGARKERQGCLCTVCPAALASNHDRPRAVHSGSQRLGTGGWPSNHPFNPPQTEGLITPHPCRSSPTKSWRRGEREGARSSERGEPPLWGQQRPGEGMGHRRPSGGPPLLHGAVPFLALLLVSTHQIYCGGLQS